jgi:hypothetical protein
MRTRLAHGIAIFSTLILGVVAVAVERPLGKEGQDPVTQSRGLTKEWPQRRECKILPTDSEWPSEGEWSQLNELVGGSILRPKPAAAPCHPEHESYDLEECVKITTGWGTSQFHADHPTSSLWTNVNNYSCLNTPDSPCTRSGFPQYVLNATQPQQIAIALKWAKERNIRINVKSTGHDFLGR